jgi:hypothetical protein
MAPRRRILARIAGLLSLPVPGGHAGQCRCPLCSHGERQARAAVGMPVRHPERITRELPAPQEEWLAAVADDLWPDDEYGDIITELRRQEGQP